MKNTNKEKYGVEYALQSKKFRDKMIKTNLERYGVEHSQQNQQIQEKTQKKC